MNGLMITKINIKAFRNLHFINFECKKQNFIKGNNMQGKTNILNAIYWCITGTDLNGSNKNLYNIPFGEEVADVEVFVNETTIRRVANKVDNKVEEHIYINNEEKPVKQAENIILGTFGLTQLALNDTKSFKILRFLLNPLYYRTVAPSDLRKYLVKMIFGTSAETTVLKRIGKNRNQANVIGQSLMKYGTITNYSKVVGDKQRENEKELKELKVIKDFLSSNNDTRYNDTLIQKENDLKAEKLNIDETVSYIKDFVLELNQFFKEQCDNKNIDIVLLEKGQGEDVWNEVCYPKLLDTRVAKNNGSTAETIFVSCLFVETVRTLLNLKPYPMLIDEGETLDANTVDSLQKCCESQLFVTLVEFYKKPSVEIQSVGE